MMTQIDQIGDETFTMTMQVNNIVYEMVYQVPQQQNFNMQHYWDTNYPTQVFLQIPNPMVWTQMYWPLTMYMHQWFQQQWTQQNQQSVPFDFFMTGTQHPETIQQPEQAETTTLDPSLRISLNLPLTAPPCQIEVDDHYTKNQLDTTLHQPFYHTPNLNITLTQDNPSHQLTSTPTQTNQSPRVHHLQQKTKP